MNRRDFIISSLGASAWLTLVWGLPLHGAENQNDYLVLGSNERFVKVRISDGKMEEVTAACIAHSVNLVPNQPNWILGLEKSAPRMSIVDFKSKAVVRNIKSPQDRVFYGHICWHPSGHGFYSTQMNVKTGQGYLSYYDAKKWTIEKDIPLINGGVHDLAWMPDKKTLAITSAGVIYAKDGKGYVKGGVRVSPSRLLFFDTEKNHIVHEWELSDPSLIIGHLKVGQDGRVYMISTLFDGYKGSNKATSGSVYSATLKEPIREWTIPPEARSKMKYEFLSVEINERENLLVATDPLGHRILQFDTQKGEFLADAEYHSNGIIWQGNRLIGTNPFLQRQKYPLGKSEIQTLPLNRMSTSAHFCLMTDAA